MSAFVVSDSTINAAITWLDTVSGKNAFSHISAHMLPEAGYEVRKEIDAYERLATDMFQLNVDAVNQRYSGGAAEFRPLNFKYSKDYSAHNAVRALKLLECWQYQCSEGDVPERPLYQLMGRIIGKIALGIVHDTEAYDRAPWGH